MNIAESDVKQQSIINVFCRTKYMFFTSYLSYILVVNLIGA